MEIFGSIQDIFCLLLIVKIELQKDSRWGELKTYIDFLALLSQNKNTLCGLSYTLEVLFSPLFWRIYCQNALALMLPLMYTEIYCSCQSLRSSILRSYIERYLLPLCGHHLHFTVHHDWPISVSFLDCWWGHEKLNNEAEIVEGKKKLYIFKYHFICLSKGFRQPCTLQVFLLLTSQLLYKQIL